MSLNNVLFRGSIICVLSKFQFPLKDKEICWEMGALSTSYGKGTASLPLKVIPLQDAGFAGSRANSTQACCIYLESASSSAVGSRIFEFAPPLGNAPKTSES